MNYNLGKVKAEMNYNLGNLTTGKVECVLCVVENSKFSAKYKT